MSKTDTTVEPTKLEQAVDASMEKHLPKIVSQEAATLIKAEVAKMRNDRAVYGEDITGLSNETKSLFVDMLRDNLKASNGQGTFDESKYGDIIEPGSTASGSALLSTAVYDGILRLAGQFGHVISRGMRVSMTEAKEDVPRQTSPDAEGAYFASTRADATETTPTFDAVNLSSEEWYMYVVVANSQLADSKPALADYIMTIMAEGLARQTDKQAFSATAGNTFGSNNSLPTVAVGSAPNQMQIVRVADKTTASIKIDTLIDAMGALADDADAGAGFYMHRSIWATLLKEKDNRGNYYLNIGGGVVGDLNRASNVSPRGQVLGYPVYTTPYLPNAATTGLTNGRFAFLTDLSKSIIFGERQSLTIDTSRHVAFAKNATAFRAIHRHAVKPGLLGAAVAIATQA